MSSLKTSADTKVLAAFSRSMHDYWGHYLAEGALLIALGVAAIIFSVVEGNLAILFLAWIFLIAGIVGLAFTVRGRQAPGFGWSMLSAFVALITGAVLLWNPLQSLIALPNTLVTLAYVLIAFFIVDGILMLILAIAHRRELSGKWEWIMANGIIDLVLAGVIIAGLPGTLVWALGLLVGIDMLFGGASLIAMALHARAELAQRGTE